MADYDLLRWDQGTGAIYGVGFIPPPSTHPTPAGNVLVFHIKYCFVMPPDVNPPNFAPNCTHCWDLRVPGFHVSLLAEDVGRWLTNAGVLPDARADILRMIFVPAWTPQDSGPIRAIAVQIESACLETPLNEYDDDDYEEELVRLQSEISMRECSAARMAASLEAVEALEKVAVGDKEREMNCAVCLEEFSSEGEVTKMPCSHVFHGDCIAKWLQYQCVCQLCRFHLPSSSDAMYC